MSIPTTTSAMRRWPALLGRLAIVGILWLNVAYAGGDDKTGSEPAVKAAIILKILKYTTWPDEAGPAENDSLRILLVGTVPDLTEWITELAEQHSERGQPVSVQALLPGEQIASGHVVVIGSDDPATISRVLRRAAGKPYLTVAGCRSCSELGVMVNLRMRHNEDGGARMRFKINVKAARKVGLRFSSQLLKLAEIVE